MAKAFRDCKNCNQTRWGQEQKTPETENTTKVDFTCSRCNTVTSETEITEPLPPILDQPLPWAMLG